MFTPDGRWPASGEALCGLGVWVAEVMLQQTQLAVVLPYWQRWMAAFPDLEALAAAGEQEVLLLWQGLGYYSRARRLRQGARRLLAQARVGAAVDTELAPSAPPRTVMPAPTVAAAPASPGTVAPPPAAGLGSVPGAVDPGAIWPRHLEGWLALPGIGRSTAGSILSSAFDRPHPILDGNVRRVLARLIAAPRPPARDQAGFWSLSAQLLDPHRPRAFNQALMDLGATVCTPRSPACDRCPWQGHCAAYAAGDPARFPVKESPRTVPFQVIGVGVVLNAAGEVLIDQRLEEGLLGGLWEFPGGKQEAGEPIEATIVRELREELAIEVEVGEALISLEHAYSHKRLRFVVHLCRWISGEPQPLASQQVRWVAPAALDAYPFPAANARIIEALRRHPLVAAIPVDAAAALPTAVLPTAALATAVRQDVA
ncbi:MAG: 8-oxo-dGTP diphosphatase MutT [Cyanobium sp.]